MKSIDPLLNRKYDSQNYHCVHFLIDAAKYLFDEDYTHCFLGLTADLSQIVRASRHTVLNNRRLDRPRDGCIVLMTNLLNESHVGLFYCGKVLHLSENGPYFQYFRSLKRNYSRFRFYEPVCLPK